MLSKQTRHGVLVHGLYIAQCRSALLDVLNVRRLKRLIVDLGEPYLLSVILSGAGHNFPWTASYGKSEQGRVIGV